jgi:hypothetical protein
MSVANYEISVQNLPISEQESQNFEIQDSKEKD